MESSHLSDELRQFHQDTRLIFLLKCSKCRQEFCKADTKCLFPLFAIKTTNTSISDQCNATHFIQEHVLGFLKCKKSIVASQHTSIIAITTTPKITIEFQWCSFSPNSEIKLGVTEFMRQQQELQRLS